MKDFTLYPEALALKELGFDEPCFAFFQVEYAESKPIMIDDEHEYRTTGYRTCKNSEIPQHYTSAPTYSQAFRFFREKYELDCSFEDGMVEDENGNEIQMWEFFIYKTKQKSDDKKMTFCSNNSNTFIESFSREEAELACLKKLIELVKSKEE